jgi:hypothetical protein
MFKPEVGKKCKFTAKLKGNPTDGDAKFEIAWVNDFAPLNQAANLDDRVSTIRSCPKWSDITTSIKGNQAEVEVDSTVPHDAWGSNTMAKEIYACIRAEYKFIGEGYLKIQSRIGSNGIDHLFVKPGEETVLVESKTKSDFRHVEHLIQGDVPDAVLRLLGKGRQMLDPAGQVMFATQMSRRWVVDCLTELEQTTIEAERRAVTEVLNDINNDKFPRRVLNVYGGLNWNADGLYDDLVAEARRQFQRLPPEKQEQLTTYVDSKYVRGTKTAQKTGKNELLYLSGKWTTADRESAHFFLLPGKYRLRVQAAQFTRVKEAPQEIDFADEKFRENEFFEIDDIATVAFEQLQPKTKLPS